MLGEGPVLSLLGYGGFHPQVIVPILRKRRITRFNERLLVMYLKRKQQQMTLFKPARSRFSTIRARFSNILKTVYNHTENMCQIHTKLFVACHAP